MPAPIALFVYNRLEFTKATVESLGKNVLAVESILYVFSDGWKTEKDRPSVEAVRSYIRSISGFKSVKIFESTLNKGLAESLISGISKVLLEHESIIVLEDDLLTSKYFLSYLNQGLDLYKGDPEVVSIHGYMYPTTDVLPQTFFIRGADCWGWATWKSGWSLFEKDSARLLDQMIAKKLSRQFDFDDSYPFTKMLIDQQNKLIDSWAIRWYASAFLQNKLTLYPAKSLVQNIGIGKGTHGDASAKKIYHTNIVEHDITLKRVEIIESVAGRASIVKHFRKTTGNVIKRTLKKILRNSW